MLRRDSGTALTEMEIRRLDTIRTYETPEGILLEMRVAGPVARACAWGIDALVRMGLYIVISILLGLYGGVGTGVMLIGFFLIEWFYPLVLEAQFGATPGKRMMGLRVVLDNGTPLSWSASAVRNLLRAADFLPLLYGFGLAAMLANRDFKRLGDLAAGTLVVYHERPVGRMELPETDPRPLPIPLSVEDQRTLLDFAERTRVLSQGRVIELADLMEGITGRTGEEARDLLLAYASWVARGK